MKNWIKYGFTLIELMLVVIIIGIWLHLRIIRYRSPGGRAQQGE